MKQLIVYYDQDCGICNKFRRYIERIDSRGMVTFKSIYDSEAAPYYELHQADPSETIVAVMDGESHVRSNAALLVLSSCNRLYKIGYIFPKVLRDAIYNWIASNRSKLGSSTCEVKKPQ